MTQLVIYHKECYDGLGAAWVCKKAMPDAEFVPATYGQAVVDITGIDEVYLVDFSYPRDILLKMKEQVQKLVVLDHHKTAEANCAGLDFCIFDMNRSGAGLAWDYFNPDIQRPKLVDYIEDRDLWRFSHPESESVHAYISSFPMAFASYDVINALLEQDFDHVVATGRAINRFVNIKVDEMCKHARWITLEGHEIPVVNCPVQFGSTVGHRLCDLYPDAPFSAYYCDAADGSQRWGLRGRDSWACSACHGSGVYTDADGIVKDDPCEACEGHGKIKDDFDVSEIAKVFGGGGHKKASGFVKQGDAKNAVLRRY